MRLLLWSCLLVGGCDPLFVEPRGGSGERCSAGLCNEGLACNSRGRCVQRLVLNRLDGYRPVSVTANDQLLLESEEGQIAWVDLADQQPQLRTADAPCEGTVKAVSPDGTLLVTSHPDGHHAICPVAGGEPIEVAHPLEILGVAVRADGGLVVGAVDRSLHPEDPTGTGRGSLGGIPAVDPTERRLALGDPQGGVRIVDERSGALEAEIETPPVRSLQWLNPQELVVTHCEAESIPDDPNGPCVPSTHISYVEVESGHVSSMRLSGVPVLAGQGARSLLAWNDCTEGRLWVVEADSGRPVADHPVAAEACAPLITAAASGRMVASAGHIWSTETGESWPAFGCEGFWLSPDGQTIAARGCEGQGSRHLRFRSRRDGQILSEVAAEAPVISVMWLDTDQVVVGTRSRRSGRQRDALSLWQPHTGELLRALTPSAVSMGLVVFADPPITLSGDGIARQWDWQRGEVVGSLHLRVASLAAALSVDGRKLALVGHPLCDMWAPDPQTLRPRCRPDDRVVQVWALETGTLLFEESLPWQFDAIDFSPGGDRVVVSARSEDALVVHLDDDPWSQSLGFLGSMQGVARFLDEDRLLVGRTVLQWRSERLHVVGSVDSDPLRVVEVSPDRQWLVVDSTQMRSTLHAWRLEDL